MEQELPAGLGKRQIAEFIEHDEIHPAKMLGNAPLAAGAPLGLKSVDQFDDVEERPRLPSRIKARATAMAKCVFPVPVPPTNTTLRWWARKFPLARSRTSVSLIGVSPYRKS